MKTTSFTRTLAVAAATALTLSAAPALAHAQGDAGITVGEPGSAEYQAPTAAPADPQQYCGTAYVGEYDDAIGAAPLPDDAKAIVGLPVVLAGGDGEHLSTTLTNSTGGYCLSIPAVAPDEIYFTIDEDRLAEYNSVPGHSTLAKTNQVFDQEMMSRAMDDISIFMMYLDLTTYKYHNANIAFSETAPPPEPMGSVESASLQFFNLPQILSGMLHGGAMGS